jgi:hypothetical protein
VKGRTPPPRGPIVTLIAGGDSHVAVYLNNTLIEQGDCEIDLVHLLEHLGVHVHTLDGEACVSPANPTWPPTLAEAMRLPVIQYQDDGSWTEGPDTLGALNQRSVPA